MGCFQCRNGARPTLSFEMTVTENQPNAQPESSVVTTQETSQNHLDRKCMHNILKPSQECHSKRSNDHDRRWDLVTEDNIIHMNVHKQMTKMKKPDSLSSTALGGTKRSCQEDSKKCIMPVKAVTKKLSKGPTLSQFKGKQTLTAGNSGMFSGLVLPPQMDRLKKMADSSITAASFLSIGSMAFDPSFLVIENLGALADTYTTLDMIGRGTFGEVWKVQHKRTGKLYALKSILKSCYLQAENMISEIEILKTLVP